MFVIYENYEGDTSPSAKVWLGDVSALNLMSDGAVRRAFDKICVELMTIIN